MKFSCDDCGAQYMIADEKIGPRGVKVRCKKCSQTIVLRPKGEVGTPSVPPPASAKPVAAPLSSAPVAAPLSSAPLSPVPEAPKPRKTAHPPPPPDSEEDEATVAVDTRSRGPSLLGDLPLGVSSDLGLSQEFAARGFDGPVRSDVAMPRGSPFSGVAMGGSLRDLASEERTPTPAPIPLTARAGLGAAFPADDSGGEVNTSVDQMPSLRAETPRIADGDDGFLGALGRADSALPAPGEFEDVATRVAKPAPEDIERSLDLSPSARDEATDTRGRALEDGDSDDAFDGSLERTVGERPIPLENGHAPIPLAARPLASAPRGGAADGLQHTSGANLEEEIGSAFEAVFGAAGGLAEDPFEAAAQNGIHAPTDEDDKKATRVFDQGAMRTLQDEQDLASGLELGVSVPPPPEPEPEPPVAVEAPREWYVAINDAQVGPLTLPELHERWSKAEIDASSLCWKQGMADWIAIRFVRELESSLMGADAPGTKLSKADLSNEPPTRAHVVAARPREPSVGVVPVTSGAAAEARAASHAAEMTEDVRDRRRASTLTDVPGEPAEPQEASEPSWRPSAASALASLAQAELESSSARVPPPPKDVAVGPAMPSKPAYEPLSSSMFGAGEQTSTRAGGLPKSADLGSAVSLRDPAPARRGKGLSVPMAVLGGSVILAIAVVVGIVALRREPAVPVVAAPPAMPANAVASAAPRPAEVASPAPVAPAADPAVAPAGAPAVEGAAAPSPAADPAVSAAPSAVPTAPVAAGAAPVATPAAAVRGLGDARPAGAAGAAGAEARAAAADARAAARERRERRAAPIAAAREAKDPKEAPAEDTLEVAAPARRPTSERPEAEDLLAEGERGSSKSRPAAAPVDDLPERLEEADILRVMRKYKADINACKEKQAKEDPALEGVMTVNLVVLKTGRTSQPNVAPDKFKASPVGKCVINAVKGWKFPQFSGPPMPIDFPIPIRGRS